VSHADGARSLALAGFIAHGESGKESIMGSADYNARFETVGHTANRRVLRALYEAAWQEVMSDPLAALRKYQPTWVAAFSPDSGSASPARAIPSNERPCCACSSRKA
jgi:hypothetical protein